MYRLKKYLYFMIFTFIVLLCLKGVSASVTYSYTDAPDSFNWGYHSGDYSFNYNRVSGEYTTGKSSSATWGIDGWKIVTDGTYKNNNAYCVQWLATLNSPSNRYLKYSKEAWDPTSKIAVVSGYIIDDIGKKYTDKERYGRTESVLQYYYAKNSSLYNKSVVGDLGYYGIDHGAVVFSEPANFVINSVNTATSKYNNISSYITGNLPTPKITATNNTLHYNSTKEIYYSDKITFSSLNAKYGNGENTDTVSYNIEISSKPDNSTVSLCTSSPINDDATCNSSISISNDSTDKVYYLKATNVNKNDKIKLKISGSNSSKYKTSYLYYNDENPSNQRLLLDGSVTVNRSISASTTLTVPDLDSYVVSIEKTDVNGNELSGAVFDLFINGTKTDWTSTSNNIFTWSSSKQSAVTDYQNGTFKFVETKAPDGFVVDNEIETSFKNDGDTCYKYTNNSTDEVVDTRVCTDKHAYMCVNDADSTDIKDLKDGNCGIYNVSSTEGDDSSGGDNTEPTTPINYSKKCVTNDNIVESTNEYCDNKYYEIKIAGTNINLVVQDKRNKVTISKRTITGKDELRGASLKVCKLADYNSKKEGCTPIKTVVSGDTGGVDVAWISSSTPASWEGIPVGDYAIVETLPPDGYATNVSTATKFSMDANGNVKAVSGDKNFETVDIKDSNGKVVDKAIVVRNKLNSVTISKTDIVTTKEIPGATLSICPAIIGSSSSSNDNNSSNDKMSNDKYSGDKYVVNKETGECIPAVLYDGSLATWKSTDKPKEISGLPAGTYYLVEITAPFGYSVAESIIFKMNADGTLTDKDGRSLVDKKIVMKDAPIKDVKTGILPIVLIGGLGVVSICGIGYAYYKASIKHLPRRRKMSNN